jgi:enamine deaminase RidA (YjgF/YER057c/UK114 family)
MQRSCFNPPGPGIVGLSQVVTVGSWITVSGQLAFLDGMLVGKGDPAAQVRQCFANISAALALADARLSDVVKLTCYLTDVAVYPAYSEVKASLFRDEPPAGTAVVVAGLLVPGALLEVEAVAFRRST